MLNRFSTFRVSTLCRSPTSTVKTGVSNLEGMAARFHELLLLRRQYSYGIIAIRPRKIVELKERQWYLRDSGFVGFA
jgi:ASC-1-like (ASCH) protein